MLMKGYIVDEPKITSAISSAEPHFRMSTISPQIEKINLNVVRNIDGVAVFKAEFSNNAIVARKPIAGLDALELSNLDTITRSGLRYSAAFLKLTTV